MKKEKDVKSFEQPALPNCEAGGLGGNTFRCLTKREYAVIFQGIFNNPRRAAICQMEAEKRGIDLQKYIAEVVILHVDEFIAKMKLTPLS